MRDIIIIGPKKTATTSIYSALDNKKLSNHVLIAKESNQFIKIPLDRIEYKFKKKNFIDISPEYFTSFRALLNIERFINETGRDALIITLKRNLLERSISHFSYMYNKRIISDKLVEAEVDNLFLTEMNIWKRFSNCDIVSCSLDQAVELISREVSHNLDMKRKNKGTEQPRSKIALRLLQFFHIFMKKILPQSRFRTKLAELVRPLIYSNNKSAKCDLIMPKDVEKLLERIRND